MLDATDLLSEAQRAFGARDWAASEAAYARLTQLPGCAAEGYYGTGVIRYMQGKTTDAEWLFLKALEHDHGHANALYYLGLLSDATTPARAEGYYAAALRANPAHSAARERLAQLQRSVAVRPMPAPIEVPGRTAPVPVPSAVAGAGVYEFLANDSSQLSRQAVQLIDSLSMERVPYFSAYLGTAIRRAVIFVALAGLGVLAAYVAPRVGRAEGSTTDLPDLRPIGILAGAVAGGAWLLSLFQLVLKVRSTKVTLANGRLYFRSGILLRRLTTTDLWVVHDIVLERPLLNRLTGDGRLVFEGATIGERSRRRGNASPRIVVAGLAKRRQLEDIYQRLQDLKFVLRANPVVKGIIQ